MLNNLKAEMARADITRADIAKEVGKTPKAVSDKLRGKTPFTLEEAIKIRVKFFPDMELEYLFSDMQAG